MRVVLVVRNLHASEAMDSPTKRLLTVEDKGTSVSTAGNMDHSPPADILLQLQNVGSRVRRSVSQGYVVTPHSFTKAHSTNTIFRSERDTLRDIFANTPSDPDHTAPALNKRGRSMADESDNAMVGSTATATIESSSTEFAMDLEGLESRPIKPLRRGRKTVSDSVLTFGAARAHPAAQLPTQVETEEEDWSLMQAEEAPSSTTFQPLAL